MLGGFEEWGYGEPGNELSTRPFGPMSIARSKTPNPPASTIATKQWVGRLSVRSDVRWVSDEELATLAPSIGDFPSARQAFESIEKRAIPADVCAQHPDERVAIRAGEFGLFTFEWRMRLAQRALRTAIIERAAWTPMLEQFGDASATRRLLKFCERAARRPGELAAVISHGFPMANLFIARWCPLDSDAIHGLAKLGYAATLLASDHYQPAHWLLIAEGVMKTLNELLDDLGNLEARVARWHCNIDLHALATCLTREPCSIPLSLLGRMASAIRAVGSAASWPSAFEPCADMKRIVLTGLAMAAQDDGEAIGIWQDQIPARPRGSLFGPLLMCSDSDIRLAAQRLIARLTRRRAAAC